MPTVFSAEYLKGISSSDLNQYFDFDGYVRQIPISASSGNDLAWTWTNELDWNQRANYDTKYVWNKVNVTYLPNICDAGSPCDGDGKIGTALPEWMMDWPEGWSGLEPLATAKFRQWLGSHGKR